MGIDGEAHGVVASACGASRATATAAMRSRIVPRAAGGQVVLQARGSEAQDDMAG